MNADELNQLLDKRFSRFEKRMEAQLALFAGQVFKHVDERIDAQTKELRSEFGERFDRLETMVDALAERVATDQEERAAIVAEQRRHGDWIGQLAKSTGTKLAPEQ